MQLRYLRIALMVCTAAALAAPALAQEAGKAAPPPPLRHRPRPTRPAIEAADLMTRLYILADDSMLGRQAGSLGNVRATDYIAAEAKRLGLRPAGEEQGSFFQTVPLVMRTPDTTSLLFAGADTLARGKDYIAIPGLPSFRFSWSFASAGAPAIYGGRLADTAALAPERFAGKVVVFAPRGPGRAPPFDFYSQDIAWDHYRGAALVLIAVLDIVPPFIVQQANNPWPALVGAPTAGAPPGIVVTRTVAERLFGKPLDQLQLGDEGAAVSGRVGFVDHPTDYPARNVIAVLPGRTPRLRAEYVAVTAHSDHVGTGAAVLHDSLEAYNRVMRAGDLRYGQPPTPEQWTRILALRDSLRDVWPERPDSVFNGAEDDATGSAALLEVAERLAAGPRPWRSILFVWHTAEEVRYLGAEWFTEHPTVPRSAIVADINLDGTGKRLPVRRDIPGALQGDLLAVGAGRLSTSFAQLVDEFATRDGIVLDKHKDAPGDPSDYYCRSDHYLYARFGIPSVFFTVGAEYPAYHQLNDDAQYIDYGHLERTTRFAADLTMAVADLDRRPALDPGRTTDPYGTCRQ